MSTPDRIPVLSPNNYVTLTVREDVRVFNDNATPTSVSAFPADVLYMKPKA